MMIFWYFDQKFQERNLNKLSSQPSQSIILQAFNFKDNNLIIVALIDAASKMVKILDFHHYFQSKRIRNIALLRSVDLCIVFEKLISEMPQENSSSIERSNGKNT